MALIRKRRLTEQQHRRIQQQQQDRQENFDPELDIEGIIVQHYGRQLEVKVCSLPKMSIDQNAVSYPLQLGDVWRCHPRTNLDALVTGDRVTWQADTTTGLGVISAVHPRSSLLSRPDRYHKLKPIAANIDLIAIVFAPLPEPSAGLIDRYLIACHDANIQPLFVLNKADLILDSGSTALNLLETYQNLGYTTLICQQHDEASLSQLKFALHQKTVAFVGQSGVGKSSLINAMIPEAQQKINVISENSALGQHTTTSTRLIEWQSSLFNGQLVQGIMIDSPGIREFGLWHLQADAIYAGFKECLPFYGQCQFRNCSHTHEQRCALQHAAQQGHISSQRLASLLRLLSECQNNP